MISIQNLIVRFGGFTALGGITLEVGRAEIFGFLGPNGAGKTTTIGVLTGQILPSGGRVTIAGHDLVRRFSRVKPLFGYVPDYDNHFDEFTAYENLQFFCRLYDIDQSSIVPALEQVELRAERNVRVQNFSKGMKKKLLIAREMLHRPQLLYLDEPTANLDIHSAENIHSTLRAMRDAGATVFLTTHNMDEAERLCDRIAIINHGMLVAVDSPSRFRRAHTENIVQVAYLDGGRECTAVLHVQRPDDRHKLAEIVNAGMLLSIHSREFNFREVFLKLTGTEFR